MHNKMKRKIAFIGTIQGLNYFQIGGTESFARRIAIEIVKNGSEVDYILYGAEENKEVALDSGITLRYFKTFTDVLSSINKEYEHIITMYLLPKDRLKYAFFRRKHNEIRFHFIYFSWPDSPVKRKLYFAEARLFPYNGKLFCISKRQYNYVKKWTDRCVYLLPPVPKRYFLSPNEKNIGERIKVAFLGRIDPSKGICEVIEIFKALKDDNRFNLSIYGIHIPEHKESFKIHKWLKNQKDIKYIEVDRDKYSLAVDDFVRAVLRKTDVFIQPYQRLSSSIDTPLLLLEAMASLCAVITKPFGNIPDIYGKSNFLVSPNNFVQDTIRLLSNISSDNLVKERERLYKRNGSLNFRTDLTVERIINEITE